jgi:hypothetical protein
MIMTNQREIAQDLMHRLISGERGQIPLHLSLLLERSLLVEGSDETQYPEILPPELANIKLSPETRDEILCALCDRVLQQPDLALIGVMSFAGTDLVIRTMSFLLTNPPRPLTLPEKAHAVTIVSKYLPSNLAANPQLLEKDELLRLISLLKHLDQTEDATGEWEVQIKHYSDNLLESLEHLRP